jgi:hypothetical protein
MELLVIAEAKRRFHDGDLQDDAESHAHADAYLAEAQAHFDAAKIALDVDKLADRYVGDGDHISEWRAATGNKSVPADDPGAVRHAAEFGPYIKGQPYSPPVETALRNLNLAGHVTPGDTLNAAIPVIAGHIAEALTDGESDAVRAWARSVADELKRIGLDLRGRVEQRAEDLNGGKPFSYDSPLRYSDQPPF